MFVIFVCYFFLLSSMSFCTLCWSFLEYTCISYDNSLDLCLNSFMQLFFYVFPSLVLIHVPVMEDWYLHKNMWKSIYTIYWCCFLFLLFVWYFPVSYCLWFNAVTMITFAINHVEYIKEKYWLLKYWNWYCLDSLRHNSNLLHHNRIWFVLWNITIFIIYMNSFVNVS